MANLASKIFIGFANPLGTNRTTQLFPIIVNMCADFLAS